MKLRIVWILIASLTFFWITNWLSDISAKEAIYWDLFLESAALEYTPPTWFQPTSLSNASEDASYWINQVLPYEEDRYEDTYLVIPQLWLVTPIVSIPDWSADKELMINWSQIDINRYLVWGIIEYANSVQPGHWGKRIDFGHSNFFKNEPGRYKSIFASLMALDPGDQAWYFVRNSSWGYDLHKYQIDQSFNVDPTTWVQYMQRDQDGWDALIFWCTHWLDGRWMILASYMWEPINKPVPYVDPFADLNSDIRRRVDKEVRKINRLRTNAKSFEIVQLIKLIQRIRDNWNLSEWKTLLLDYIEFKLVSIYPS